MIADREEAQLPLLLRCSYDHACASRVVLCRPLCSAHLRETGSCSVTRARVLQRGAPPPMLEEQASFHAFSAPFACTHLYFFLPGIL